jgi:histidine triad (HIT) family protein
MARAPRRCIFCDILAGDLPAAFVSREPAGIAIMDAYPLRPGHVLVMPSRHEPLVTGLTAGERAFLMETGSRIALAMRDGNPQCEDINWMVNDGRIAGQHVPHVHLHLIPRSRGDSAAVTAAYAARPLSMLRRPDIARLELQAARIRERLA